MRIIAVHGIGRHAADFHHAWEEKLRAALPNTDLEVLGLQWSDEQDQVADRRIGVSGIRISGRSTQGVKLMNIDDEDLVVAVAKLAEGEEADAAGESEVTGSGDVTSAQLATVDEPAN